MFLGTLRSASPWQSTVLPEQEHCAGHGCGATSPAIASNSPRDRVNFPQPHIITARCRPAGARLPRPRGGAGRAALLLAAGNVRATFRVRRKRSPFYPKPSQENNPGKVRWVAPIRGWRQLRWEGGRPGPFFASPSDGEERRHSGRAPCEGEANPRSLRAQRSWATSLSSSSPLSKPWLAGEPRPPNQRASSAAGRAAQQSLPRASPAAGRSQPHGGRRRGWHRAHTALPEALQQIIPLSQAFIKLSHGRRREGRKKKSQTHEMMLGLAFHPPRPLLL